MNSIHPSIPLLEGTQAAQASRGGGELFGRRTNEPTPLAEAAGNGDLRHDGGRSARP